MVSLQSLCFSQQNPTPSHLLQQRRPQKALELEVLLRDTPLPLPEYRRLLLLNSPPDCDCARARLRTILNGRYTKTCCVAHPGPAIGIVGGWQELPARRFALEPGAGEAVEAVQGGGGLQGSFGVGAVIHFGGGEELHTGNAGRCLKRVVQGGSFSRRSSRCDNRRRSSESACVHS